MNKIFKTKNFFQLFIVFIVFGISGSLSVVISGPFLDLIGLNNFENSITKLIIRLLIIFPLYQLILIFIGTVFGQFKYFWEFEKRFWSRLFNKTEK
tara:strand:- start:587 stop:874 length:288 start_codon:yes stop_codon:yes gene_type:complete